MLQRLADLMWARHRNPWSGWTRIALGVALPFVLWSNDPWATAALVVLVVTNPFWFPPPRDDRALMTRAVDGERAFLATAPWTLKAMLLWVPAPLAVGAVWALWSHQLGWSLLLIVTLYAGKILFLVHVLPLAGAPRPPDR